MRGRGYWILREFSFGDSIFCSSYLMAGLLPIFPLGSALAHFVIVRYYETYSENVKNERNPWRWIEYSITAAVMLWILATLSGLDSLISLVFLVELNVALMYCGYQAEENKRSDRKNMTAVWLYTAAGWVLHFTIWAAISLTFFDAVSTSPDRVPDLVWAIGPTLFFLHTTFGVNQLLYLLDVISFEKEELFFAVLSLAAKSTLIWMSIGGTLRSNEDSRC